jgi:hypothetical protein
MGMGCEGAFDGSDEFSTLCFHRIQAWLKGSLEHDTFESYPAGIFQNQVDGQNL